MARDRSSAAKRDASNSSPGLTYTVQPSTCRGYRAPLGVKGRDSRGVFVWSGAENALVEFPHQTCRLTPRRGARLRRSVNVQRRVRQCDAKALGVTTSSGLKGSCDSIWVSDQFQVHSVDYHYDETCRLSDHALVHVTLEA